MKLFFKNVLANILAIILIGIVGCVFFLIFVGFSIASSEPDIAIKDDTVLLINSETVILDAPTEIMTSLFSAEEHQQVLLEDLLTSIRNAKSDSKIKGISIELSNFNAGVTQVDDIRKALIDFKKSGKFIYAYGDNVSQKSYYLGSVADKYFLNPVGGIELKGMSTEVVFLKNFADKLGVDIQVIRHGKFKAAVEPFMKNKISPENKEQLSVLLNDIWADISQDISVSRKMDAQSFKNKVDSLYGVIPDDCLKHRLVDQLVQKSEFDAFLKKQLGLDDESKIHKVSITDYVRKNNKKTRNEKKDHIAILYASGSIYNGDGYQDIYHKNLIKEIQEVKENKNVKGVVLRVNSPGGSGNASDQILFELQELKKVKPLVVSFGDYAASGGYYIAMAGEKIYSEPNTITGSIGVFGVVPNGKELANKNGIRADVVKTNDNANFYSPLEGLSQGALSVMTKNVEMTYKRFVYFVAKNRNKSFEEIDAVGGGRVWSGKRAKEIGLVDELGSLDDAVNYLAQKLNNKEIKTLPYPKMKSKWELIMSELDEEKMTNKLIERKIGENYAGWLGYFTEPKKQGSVLMTTPYKISMD